MTAHPDEHRKNKEDSCRIPETKRGERRARAIADESPSEENCSQDRRPIDLSPGR
jgi:hypothetical protein